MVRMTIHALCLLYLTNAPTLAEEAFDLEWTKARYREADAFTLPENIVVKWRTTTYPAETAEDLDRLREIVGDKPDHPLRQRMELLARQLVTPDGLTSTLWYENEERFRISSTYSEDMPVDYNDTAVNGESVWRLTDRSLHLFSLGKTPDGENPYFSIRPLRVHLMYLFFNSFVSGPLGISPISVSRSGENWSCVAETASGERRYRKTGVIVTDGDRKDLRVIRSEVTRAEDVSLVGATTLFTEWRFSSYLGRFVPHKYENLRSDGTLRFTVELIDIRHLEPKELEPLLATPVAAGDDPIRGPATFTSVYDSRSGETRIAPGPTDEFRHLGSGSDNERIAIWKILVVGSVVILFMLIAIRYRQSSQ